MRINTQFSFSDANGDVQIDPDGDAPAIGPALAVRHKTLDRARVHRDGRLVLTFEDHSVIDVPAHDRYEAWEASGGEERDHIVLVSPIAPDTAW